MLGRLAFALAIYLFVPTTAAPAAVNGALIRVAGSLGAVRGDAQLRSVIPEDTKEVYAGVFVPTNEKTRIEFRWYTPEGDEARRSVKTAFYSAQRGNAAAWDSVLLSGALGWWRVEASFEGGFLSKKFLVTENRRILDVIEGDSLTKLRIIRSVDPSEAPGRDVLLAAVEDTDPDIRSAAFEKMAGVRADWAADAVRSGLSDREQSVRLAAMGSSGSLPKAERMAVYVSALGSPAPAIRQAAARGLKGFEDETASDALLGALSDPDPGVRLAALNSLTGLNPPGMDAALLELVSDSDYMVSKAALEVVLNESNSASRAMALSEAALGEHDDLSRRAIDALLPAGEPIALAAYWRHFSEGYKRPEVLRAMVSVPGEEAVDYIGRAYRLCADDEELRRQAVSGLAGRGEAAAELLREALSDPSPEVRLAATGSISSLENTPGKADMLGGALDDSDPAVRKAALAVLSEMDTRDAYELLTDALNNNSLKTDAIGYIETGPAPGLLDMLAGKGHAVTDPRLRVRVVGILHEAGFGTQAVASYLADPDLGVRKAALDSLKKTATADALAAMMPALDDEALREDALKHIESGLAPGVFKALEEKCGTISDGVFRARVVDVLASRGMGEEGLAVYLDDPEPAVRKAALDALAERGTAEAFTIMMGALDSEDTRSVAMRHIERGLSTGRMDALAAKGISIPDPVFRARVVKVIASARTRADLLAPYLGDPDQGVRRSALDGLSAMAAQGQARNKEIFTPGILGSISEKGREMPDARSRARVVGVLAAGGMDADGLSVYLDDPDPSVRTAAIKALARIGNREAFTRLLPLLDSEELRDEALGEIGSGLTPELLSMLADKGRTIADSMFRARVVMMLASGGLGADGLAAYLDDPDPGVRAESVAGISSLNGPEAAFGLYIACGDRQAHIREAAAIGLGKMEPPVLLDGLDLLFNRGKADEVVVGFIAENVREPRVIKGLVGRVPSDDTQMLSAALWPLMGDKELFSAALSEIKGGPGPGLLEDLSRKNRAVENSWDRRMNVATLAKAGLGVDGLCPYLDDPDAGVRLEAVRRLARLKGPEAAYCLFLAGKDPRAEIVGEALEGIGRMDANELEGGINLLFERGRADSGAVSFIAGGVSDPRVLETLVDKIPAEDTARLRAFVVQVAGRSLETDVPALARGLKAEDAELFMEVSGRLAAIGLPSATAALLDGYVRRPEMRARLLETCAGSVHAADIVKKALADEDAGIRVKAAGYLGNIPKEKAARLVMLAMSDNDARVRAMATAAAGRMGLPDGLALAASDPDLDVRKAAAEGLAGSEGGASVLAKLALDPEPAVSDAALEGLKRMDTSVDTATWSRLAEVAASSNVRVAAIDALSKRELPELAGVFAGALGDSDPEVAKAGTAALLALGKDGLSAVYPLLDDEGARERTLSVIGAVSDASSEPYLIAALPSLKGRALSGAIGVLGKLGGGESLEAMSDIYNGADESLRTKVLRAVAGLRISGDEPELVGMLSDALDSESEPVRFYAARAAGEKGVVSLKEKLTSVLDSEGSALIAGEIRKALDRLDGKP